jgi:hypothetical protein
VTGQSEHVRAGESARLLFDSNRSLVIDLLAEACDGNQQRSAAISAVSVFHAR